VPPRPRACAVENFDRCPYKLRDCRKHHPLPEAWMLLTVDDIAARFSAGEIKLLRFRRNSRRDDVFLVPPSAWPCMKSGQATVARFPADPMTDDRRTADLRKQGIVRPAPARAKTDACKNAPPTSPPMGVRAAGVHPEPRGRARPSRACSG